MNRKQSIACSALIAIGASFSLSPASAEQIKINTNLLNIYKGTPNTKDKGGTKTKPATTLSPALNFGLGPATTKDTKDNKQQKSTTKLSPAVINRLIKSGSVPRSIPTNTRLTPALINPSTNKINPRSLMILQGLGEKARNGTATNSEIEEMMRLCNENKDFSSSVSTTNSGSSKNTSDKKDKNNWNNDFSSNFAEKWNNKTTGKGSGGFKLNKKEVSLGGGGSKTTNSQGERSGSQTNKQKGSTDRSSTSSSERQFANSSENMQMRVAQRECDAVLALMGTQDTNKTTVETTRMQLEDNKAQREHEKEMLELKLRSDQEDKWVQMGTGLLQNIFSGAGQKNESNLQRESELESVIMRQQQQIDALMEKLDSQE